jgi:tRNA (guanine37-N1)-methyltransferase
MKIDIITLFPDLYTEFIKTYPVSKGIDKEALDVNLHNLRDFAIDARGSVDEKPYGGGVGMLLRPEPVFEAVESIKKLKNSKVVLLSPKGQRYTQGKAVEYSKLDQLILICGRYEGVDARIEDNLVDEAISIGDYVLSGGELASMVVVESVTRLLPGILEKEEATEIESFSEDMLEFPQYTRPEDFRGMKVPEVLLSGHHAEIEKWKKENQEKIS